MEIDRVAPKTTSERTRVSNAPRAPDRVAARVAGSSLGSMEWLAPRRWGHPNRSIVGRPKRKPCR